MYRREIRIGIRTFRAFISMLSPKHHGWSLYVEANIPLLVGGDLLVRNCGLANVMNMSRYTVRTLVHRMLDEVVDLRNVITYNVNDFQETGRLFCGRAGTNVFQRCVGAIDGTHIRIKCPVRKHDVYYNYKHFYSMQAQVVVSSKYYFTDVFVGYAGSVHDTRVFRNSPLYNRGTYPPPGYYLLGDSGKLYSYSNLFIC